MTEHTLKLQDKFVFIERVIASISQIKRFLMGVAGSVYQFIVFRKQAGHR